MGLGFSSNFNKKMKEAEKKGFLDAYRSAGGVIKRACVALGIDESTFYYWRRNDKDFAAAFEEARIDYVEGRLMERINAGDTTAMIYFLKTKGRHRGWSEKLPQPAAPKVTSEEAEATKLTIKRRISGKKTYIIKQLKAHGIYSGERSQQVSIAATLLVRTEMLAEEVLAESGEAMGVEISREGNERRTISPKEKLYLDYVQQTQKALRALGMNADAKEQKAEADTLNEFLKSIGEE